MAGLKTKGGDVTVYKVSLDSQYWWVKWDEYFCEWLVMSLVSLADYIGK